MQDNQSNRLATLYSTCPLQAIITLADDLSNTIDIFDTCESAAETAASKKSGLSYTIGLANDQLRRYSDELTCLRNHLRIQSNTELASLVQRAESAQQTGEQ